MSIQVNAIVRAADQLVPAVTQPVPAAAQPVPAAGTFTEPTFLRMKAKTEVVILPEMEATLSEHQLMMAREKGIILYLDPPGWMAQWDCCDCKEFGELEGKPPGTDYSMRREPDCKMVCPTKGCEHVVCDTCVARWADPYYEELFCGQKVLGLEREEEDDDDDDDDDEMEEEEDDDDDDRLPRA